MMVSRDQKDVPPPRSLEMFGSQGDQSRLSGCNEAGKELSVQVKEERGDSVLWPHPAARRSYRVL